MPLLGKEEFHLKSLPEDLSPDEQVFYCQITGEAFLTYDEYFERQFLYSSLLWTCSLTGRTGLTYSEALKSEQESRELVSTIPKILQKVILHLMNYIDNFSMNVILSILIEYTNLRYFIGEHVQITPKKRGKRINGIIRDVIAPELNENQLSSANSIAYGLDPLSYSYLVECIDEQSLENVKYLNNVQIDDNNCIIIPAARIQRSKFLLTREKIRLFLKQHLATRNGRYKPLKIKPESLKKFGVDQMQWSDIFKGPLPNFNDDTFVVKALNRQRYMMIMDGEDNNNNNDPELQQQQSPNEQSKENQENINETNEELIKKKKSNLLSNQKEKLMKMTKSAKKNKKSKDVKKSKKKQSKSKKNTTDNDNEESKSNSKESVENEKDAKNAEKEHRKQYEDDLKLWNEKRDDLLCDDLVELPMANSIDCDISNELLSDSFMIVDFINIFHEFIAFDHQNFPKQLKFDYFIKILNDTNVKSIGGIADLLISLMKTIYQSTNSNYNSANDEDRNILNDDLRIDESSYDNNCENNELDDDNNHKDASTNSSSKTTNQLYCSVNQFVTTYFSKIDKLMCLPLDQYTISEILRIYIYKTRNIVNNGKIVIKIFEEDFKLVKLLSSRTIFELNQHDRIKILKILLNDIVTNVNEIRQKIESTLDEMVKLKLQIRHLNALHSRWLRENPIRQRLRRRRLNPNHLENQQTNDTNEILTEEEKQQYLREKIERETKLKKDVVELKAQIRHLSTYSRLRPIGMDRNYRKYWLFDTIPGLFVEKIINNEYGTIDHPINQCFDDPNPKSKPKLDEYLRKKQKKTANKIDDDKNKVEETVDVNREPIIRCTGDSTTCQVHRGCYFNTVNDKVNIKHVWTFYTKEQLNDLIESLNERGFRESELKAMLSFEKESILSRHLNEFDPYSMNPDYIPIKTLSSSQSMIEDENQDESDFQQLRKSERLQIQQITMAHNNHLNNKRNNSKNDFHLENDTNHTVIEIFDEQLRNHLSLFEDNIFNGCFCSFSASDREDWYRDLNVNNCQSNKKESLKLLTGKLSKLARSMRPFCLMPPLCVYQSDTLQLSPSIYDEENIDHDQLMRFLQQQQPQLSEKWLDILKVPDNDEIENENISNDFNGITNHSQLFLNIYILERSINWSMSALKTANKCHICRRKANDEMILCDHCNYGYHIYCLQPPISSIDEIEGDWYCHKCLPRTTNHLDASKKSSISKTTDHSSKNDSTINNNLDENIPRCESCLKQISNSYSQVSCKTCNKHYHLNCMNMARIPRAWNCADCSMENNKLNESSDNQDMNHHIGNNNCELRRSQRKRKPNINYEEYNVDNSTIITNDENMNNNNNSNDAFNCQSSANHLKSRKCSTNDRNNDYHRIIVK